MPGQQMPAAQAPMAGVPANGQGPAAAAQPEDDPFVRRSDMQAADQRLGATIMDAVNNADNQVRQSIGPEVEAAVSRKLGPLTHERMEDWAAKIQTAIVEAQGQTTSLEGRTGAMAQQIEIMLNETLNKIQETRATSR